MTERLDEKGRIHVFDISDIRDHIELNSMEGQYNFVACCEDFVVNGTHQIDLRSRADAANIPILGETSSGFAADWLVTENDRFYFCGQIIGVKLLEFVEFDDGQYTLPIIGQFKTPGHCYGVAEQDGIVYLADEYSLILLEAPELNEARLTNIDIPKEFDMLTTYPNPFNSSITIEFFLPMGSMVNMSVYDIHGREISSSVYGQIKVGIHRTIWKAENNPSDIYLIKMYADEKSICKRLF